MRIKSGSNSENNYEVTVDGGIEAGSGIGGRDRVRNNGRTAVGRVVSGVDEWRYWGQKTRIRADDPDDLLISINNKSWEPASAYGGKPIDGSSGNSGDSSRDGPADDPPKQDSSGSTSVPVGGAIGGSLNNSRPGLGCVARPMYSGGDIEMHVGSGREYGSLQAAFNDVPHYVQHEVRIYVHGRTADTNSAHIHSVSMANHVDFIVDGSDGGVVNDGGVNVGIDGKLDHIQFHDLTFEHISQCKDARFVRCDFNGNGTAAFSGKMGGKMLINCDIGSGNDDYAVFSIGNEMCELRGCTLRGEKAAVKAIGTATHALTGNNDVRAPKKMVGGADDVFVGGERL